MMKMLALVVSLLVSLGSDGEVVRRGVPIPPEAERVALSTVVARPAAFTNRDVVVDGVVERVCRMAGCWMTIAPAPGATGIRVTFKEGAFVVPRGSGGRIVRAVGRARVKGNRVSFIASGLELGP